MCLTKLNGNYVVFASVNLAINYFFFVETSLLLQKEEKKRKKIQTEIVKFVNTRFSIRHRQNFN